MLHFCLCKWFFAFSFQTPVARCWCTFVYWSCILQLCCLLTSSRSVFCWVLGVFTFSSVNKDNFISSFPICTPFFFFLIWSLKSGFPGFENIIQAFFLSLIFSNTSHGLSNSSLSSRNRQFSHLVDWMGLGFFLLFLFFLSGKSSDTDQVLTFLVGKGSISLVPITQSE